LIAGALAQLTAHLKPITARQGHIQQHQIHRLLGRELQGRPTIGGTGQGIAPLTQQIEHRLAEFGIVLHHQHFHGVATAAAHHF